jgi:hypothetical protein
MREPKRGSNLLSPPVMEPTAGGQPTLLSNGLYLRQSLRQSHPGPSVLVPACLPSLAVDNRTHRGCTERRWFVKPIGVTGPNGSKTVYCRVPVDI